MRHSLNFCLQNAWDREVQRIQVQRIWWSICQKLQFCQQLLGGLSGAGQRRICRKTYFLSGYVPLDPGDYMLSEKFLAGVMLTRSLAKTTISGVNPFALLLSAPWPSRQVQAPSRSFFILKRILLLAPVQIFVVCPVQSSQRWVCVVCPVQSSQRWVGGLAI